MTTTLINAAEFRKLVEALDGSQILSDWGAEGAAIQALERFLLPHAPALLALVEADARRQQQIDIDEHDAWRDAMFEGWARRQRL